MLDLVFADKVTPNEVALRIQLDPLCSAATATLELHLDNDVLYELVFDNDNPHVRALRN